jgi:hypothetical protein
VKFDCPSCQVTINNMDVKARRRQGLANQIQCPKCDSWLRLNPKIEAIKMAGLSVLLVTSVLNILLVFPEFEHELSIAGIVGVSLALFAFLKGKREVV